MSKIKILTISDHPLSASGVGTQTRHFINKMLKTGKYQFISMAGAIQHVDDRPGKTKEWGDDWIIYPVKSYGNEEIIRSTLRTHRPDILWFMTDPRFYGWLWRMENEIRSLVPMIYYHVWDNFPHPHFNYPAYMSNDVVVTISKVTSDIVKNVAPSVEEHYIPHSVDLNEFKKISSEQVKHFRESNFPGKKFIVFWNNRNARRKQTGTLIQCFKEFIERPGINKDECLLLLHTDPKDPHGQDLHVLMRDFELNDGHVKISINKLQTDNLVLVYNSVDCTVNISDAEGFGLGTFESLACEIPIIVNMTGGLQEQVTKLDKVTEKIMVERARNSVGPVKYEHGFGIESKSKALIGSQEVPYIYEDRILPEHFVSALEMMYHLSPEERASMGRAGRKHLEENYNPDVLMEKWDKLLFSVYNKYGSWKTRRGYRNWEMRHF